MALSESLPNIVRDLDAKIAKLQSARVLICDMMTRYDIPIPTPPTGPVAVTTTRSTSPKPVFKSVKPVVKLPANTHVKVVTPTMIPDVIKGILLGTKTPLTVDEILGVLLKDHKYQVAYPSLSLYLKKTLGLTSVGKRGTALTYQIGDPINDSPKSPVNPGPKVVKGSSKSKPTVHKAPAEIPVDVILDVMKIGRQTAAQVATKLERNFVNVDPDAVTERLNELVDSGVLETDDGDGNHGNPAYWI